MVNNNNKTIHPILFLDDWPAPPSGGGGGGTRPGDEDHMGPGMNQMKKWRIQTLLAVNPWGIPVMAFKEAYERMYPGKVFEPTEHGYENIGAMVYDLPDMFAVQEPDDVTTLMFPDYPHDKILHDARLGHDFGQPEPLSSSSSSSAATIKDGHQYQQASSYADPCGQLQPNSPHKSAIESQQQLASSRWRISASIESSTVGSHRNQPSLVVTTDANGLDNATAAKTIDPDILISYAWIRRDTDFPQDVVLAGEQYTDLILPLTSANIPGTRGVHQAKIVGVANPSSFYINVKSADTSRNEQLTSEIYQFFMQLGPNIDQYNVPEEFIYPGFPCLVYSREFKCWERCVVVSRSRRTNRVLVEYVDFGGTINVNRIYLYLMPRKFFDLPKQAILCSLIGLRPRKDDKWSPSSSCRMRCFSQPRYWLDLLLVDPKIEITAAATATNLVAANGGDKSAAAASNPASSELASLSNSTAIPETSIITTAQTSEGQPKPTLSQEQQAKPKRKKRVLQKKLDFEAIICDRHDEFGLMDIFLDDILVMETYAALDTNREAEYNSLKNSFKKALTTLPRPNNPFMLGGTMKFWPKLSSSGVRVAPPTIEVQMEGREAD